MSIAEKLTQIAENEQKVFDAGMKSEYDRFWDVFQDHGNRRNYTMGLAGPGWTDETFKPKYPIVIEDGSDGYVFRDNQTTHIPRVEVLAATRINQLFYHAKCVQTIDCLYFHNEITNFSNTFNSCIALENLIIDGEVDRPIAGSISLQQSSKLTSASVDSIINALKDLTGQTAQTLTLHATVGANVTDAQKATFTAKNWTLVF